MSIRAFRRLQEGKTKKPRGTHARQTRGGHHGSSGLTVKCEEEHPHPDCPAICNLFKGHQGRHKGYVMHGTKSNASGVIRLKGRVEVLWTDQEAVEFAANAKKAKDAAEEAGRVVIKASDGRKWMGDEVEHVVDGTEGTKEEARPEQAVNSE